MQEHYPENCAWTIKKYSGSLLTQDLSWTQTNKCKRGGKKGETMNIGSCTCGQKESLIHFLFVISRFLFSIAIVYFTVIQVSRLQRTGLATGRTSLRLLVIGRSGGGSWGVTHVAAEGLEVVFEQCYCFDGRNPADQLRLVVYPIVYRAFYIPGGVGFLPLNFRVPKNLTTLHWSTKDRSCRKGWSSCAKKCHGFCFSRFGSRQTPVDLLL